MRGLPYLVLGVVALAASQAAADPAGPRDAARADGSESRLAQLTAALQAVGDAVFGLPVPAGASVVERTADFAHFRSPASFNGLLDFYEGELPRHRTERHPDGAKLAGVGERPIDVYLLPRDGAVDVYYFPPPPELPEVSGRSDGDLQRPRRGSRQELPRDTGIVAPSDVLEWLEPNPSGGSGLYESRVVEQGGESVTVFVPRGEADEAVEAASAAPSTTPEEWHRLARHSGGGYERGNGERSLRPTPALGDDGEPLPFFGNERHRGSSRAPY